MSTKWVYLFTEVSDAEEHAGSWAGVRALLGGKGANLGEMTRIGVPVPPGFTVSTEACNAYLAAGETFPEGMWEQELEAMKEHLGNIDTELEMMIGRGVGLHLREIKKQLYMVRQHLDKLISEIQKDKTLVGHS